MISVQWVLFGYSLAFGPDIGGVIGGLKMLGLAGVGPEPGPYSETIPHLAFMIFQGMLLTFYLLSAVLLTSRLRIEKGERRDDVVAVGWYVDIPNDYVRRDNNCCVFICRP